MKRNSSMIHVKYISLALVLSFLSVIASKGQTKTSLTQYFQLPFIYNPGLTGIENYTDLKAGYRRQWNNFNKAPKSFFVGGNHRFGLAATEADESPKIAHGISGYIFRENISDFEQTQIGASYAVHVPLTSQWKISSGFNVGYNQFKIGAQDWIIRDYQDAIYHGLQSSGSLNYMAMDWGAVLYSDKISGGYSASGLVNERLGSDLNSDAKLAIRHKAFISYNYELNHEVEIIPTFLFQYENPLDPLYSFNIKARLKSFAWTGIGYTANKAMTFLLGISSIKNFNFSYSYDISIGDANHLGAGNHELIAGYVLFNKNRKKAFLW